MMINFGCSGCLLPLLILFNLFFGWIFIRPLLLWLCVQAALVGIFLLNSYIVIRHFSATGGKKQRKDAVDVEAEVVEEDRKLK